MQRQTIVSALLLSLTMGAAMASTECTKLPKSQWMPQEKMMAKLKAEGYEIKKFKVEDSCYEIYGHDKAGHKVEVYFDPVTGAVVKSKQGD